MKKSRVSHDSTTHQHEHDQGSEVMLSKPLTSRQQLPPTYLNASTGTAISSVNGTLVVHVKADAYNYNSIISNGGVSTSGDNNNTTTISYEQLQQEFYQSYDPSIGLHTAAVLGGILVWLVLYVIYRTKIRKWIIGLVKKKFGTHDELDNKSSDSEKDSNSGTNPNMVRPLINPSIVIEGSPPESLPQSPTTYDQYPKHGMNECMSPYSLTGAGMNEDGMVFQFPGHLGSQQQLHLYHQQCCPDQHEIYLQLPRSEMDIPSATAQWVQNMPLAARSHQDFAGLMLSMQSHGMLSLHKPCSCPMVCPRSPQPLPLLDLPNSWNKSLPVLSNSISSQLLSAYDRVTSSQNTGKDVKDIINAKRKMNRRKRHDNRDQEGEECDELIKKTEIGKEDIEKWKGQTDVGNQTGNNKKKSAKTPPHLTIKIPDSKDNATLISNSSFTRSPVPIPVTPTVMIQNSKPVSRRHHGYDSNTSMSSSSSIDFLLAPPLASPRHMSKPGSPHMIPSPHLLSPTCEGRKHSGSSNNTFTWNREDIKRYHDGKDLRRSGSVSPHLCRLSHHQCSFKKKKNINTGTKNIGHQHLDKTLRRHNSLGESHLPQLPSVMSTVPPLSPQIQQHRRSFSDYHARFQRDFLTSSPSSQSSQSRGHHQRSLSADVAFSINLQREQGSPTYSNESNKNSLGTSSYSHSPSPNLLRVPDSGNFRAMTPDFGTNNNNNHGMYSSDNPPSMRHCVHSDSNIAYYAGQLLQVGPHEDGGLVRRHSTYVPGSGEINLSFCGDNIVRASSSYGSSSSYNSSHHHSHHHHHHSHLPTHAHHHSHYHRDQQRHRHQPHHHQHQHHQLHHSTGMLAVDTPDNRQRASCSPHNLQSNLNRSFSAVVMETKL